MNRKLIYRTLDLVDLDLPENAPCGSHHKRGKILYAANGFARVILETGEAVDIPEKFVSVTNPMPGADTLKTEMAALEAENSVLRARVGELADMLGNVTLYLRSTAPHLRDEALALLAKTEGRAE